MTTSQVAFDDVTSTDQSLRAVYGGQEDLVRMPPQPAPPRRVTINTDEVRGLVGDIVDGALAGLPQSLHAEVDRLVATVVLPKMRPIAEGVVDRELTAVRAEHQREIGWLRGQLADVKAATERPPIVHGYACSTCGDLGHNSRGCHGKERPPAPQPPPAAPVPSAAPPKPAAIKVDRAQIDRSVREVLSETPPVALTAVRQMVHAEVRVQIDELRQTVLSDIKAVANLLESLRAEVETVKRRNLLLQDEIATLRAEVAKAALGGVDIDEWLKPDAEEAAEEGAAGAGAEEGSP